MDSGEVHSIKTTETRHLRWTTGLSLRTYSMVRSAGETSITMVTRMFCKPGLNKVTPPEQRSPLFIRIIMGHGRPAQTSFFPQWAKIFWVARNGLTITTMAFLILSLREDRF